MVRDGVFSDEVWAVVEPLLPSSKGRAGRPWTDHRRALEGIAWRYRTGSPWRDLPVEFGPWQTVWERHFRWSQDGTYQRIFDGVHLAGLLQQSLDPAEPRHVCRLRPTGQDPGHRRPMPRLRATDCPPLP